MLVVLIFSAALSTSSHDAEATATSKVSAVYTLAKLFGGATKTADTTGEHPTW